MNAKYTIGGLIIVAFLIWGVSAFLKTTIQYVSLEEAADSRQTVQVMGKIDFDVVVYDTTTSRLEFAIYDTEAESKESAPRLDVVYYDVPPGNFNQATSVVLKGRPDNSGVFVVEQMLVKCPSKYQGEEGEYQNPEKHDEATAGKSGV